VDVDCISRQNGLHTKTMVAPCIRHRRVDNNIKPPLPNDKTTTTTTDQQQQPTNNNNQQPITTKSSTAQQPTNDLKRNNHLAAIIRQATAERDALKDTYDIGRISARENRR
jgi:hypothetical protein